MPHAPNQAAPAAIILTLLRQGATEAAEAALGKPITHCPPDASARLSDEELCARVLLADRHPDDRVLTKGRHPRFPGHAVYRGPSRQGSSARYAAITPGKTVRQLLMRGVTRRMIREAVKNGWVVLR
jgi:hypothetical protein